MPYPDGELSSPDPLQDSPTYSSPSKSQNQTRIRRSLPLQGISPRKQTFELDVGNELSPQKIRVTVEAESDKENGSRAYEGRKSISPTRYHAPIIRREEKTTTTTIPVKGLSDSDDDTVQPGAETPKRSRGRPRKSAGTPIPCNSETRKVTPSRRRRRTLGSLVDGDDEEDWDFKIGVGVEIGRGKGRSRSRSIKSVSRKTTTPVSQSTISSDKLTSSSSIKSGARRKTLTPNEFLILEDQPEAAVEDPDSSQTFDCPNRALDTATGNTLSKSSSLSSISTFEFEEPEGSAVEPVELTPVQKLPVTTIRSNKSNRSRSPIREMRRTPCETSYSQESANTDLLKDEKTQTRREDVEYQSERYEEEIDGVGDLLEFDTILESEGFSMISVESVPSFRAQFSSPAEQPQESGNKTPTPVNRTIYSLNQFMQAKEEDSFSSIPPEILEAATPGRKAIKNNYLALRNTYVVGDDDPASSIQQQILEVSTPARKLQYDKLLPIPQSERNAVEDSFSSIPPEILKAATPARYVQPHIVESSTATEVKIHEISFSRIPPDVLEAAIPGKPDRANTFVVIPRPGYYQYTSSRTSPVLEAIPSTQTPQNDFPVAREKPEFVETIVTNSRLLVPRTSDEVNNEIRAGSRLLTPEDTPSPPPETEKQEVSGVSQTFSQSSSGRDFNESQKSEGSLIPHSQLKSSPPSGLPRRFVNSAHLRQPELLHLHPPVMETPSIVFSSPSLPPLIMKNPLQRRNVSSLNRYTTGEQEADLFPSIRAGKALQDLNLPSANRNRSQALASPFKSPVTRRSSSAASGGAPNSDLFNNKVQSHRQRSSMTNDIAFGGFSDDTRRELRKSLIMGEELARSQESAEANNWSSKMTTTREEDPFRSGSQSRRSPLPEDKQEYSLEIPTDRGVSQQGSSRQISSVCSYDAMNWQPEKTIQAGSQLDSEPLGSGNKVQQARQYPEVLTTSELYDGMPYMWQETREEQWARERAAVSREIESASTSQVIVLSSDVSKAWNDQSDISDDEDIWQAEARNSSSLLKDKSVNESRNQEPVEKPRRSKIPSPWRKNSRRLIYSDEFTHSSSPPKIEPNVFPNHLLPRKEPSCSQNDSLSSALRIEKRGGLFSLESRHVPSKPLQEIVQRTVVPPRRISVMEENISSPIDASFFRQIPQKMNFAPRPRNNPKLDLSALLESSPVTARQDESRLMNTSAALRSQLLGSGEDESDHPKSQAISSQNITATISSLSFEHFDSRSYDQSVTDVSQISTKDPTSTTLESDLDLSAASIASESSGLLQNDSSSQSSLFLPSIPGPLTPNPSATPQKSCIKTLSSTSPTKSVVFHSPTPSPPPLSGTTWSKDHWKLLDALYKDYFRLGPQCYGAGAEGQKSRLVGKSIVSQGDCMEIEAWHLDIVFAFRDEVPGWEEGNIAKRLFALIVGERRREEGRI